MTAPNPRAQAAPPVPALIIAVGDNPRQAAAAIVPIFLRGDARRAALTDCYSLAAGEDGSPLLAPLDAAAAAAPAGPLTRREVFLRALGQSRALTESLEQALYALRMHERLIRGGWETVFPVPLNVYLAAQAADPYSAGMLLPLLSILQNLSAGMDLCRVHLLLDTAVFLGTAGEDAAAEFETAALLADLDELLGGFLVTAKTGTSLRKKLDAALGLPAEAAALPAVYLFDNFKEGSIAAADRAEMRILLGNALLALLQNDLAGRLAGSLDEGEIFAGKRYYHSIGAAGVIYDPQAIQAACALKAAREFLDTIILAGSADPQRAAAEAQAVWTDCGDLAAWFNGLAGLLPAAVQPQGIDPHSSGPVVHFTDLVLQEIDLEKLRETPWPRQIQEHRARFAGQALPALSALAGALQAEIEQARAGVEELRARFQAAAAQLAAQAPAGQEWREPFRVSAADPCLEQWAYARFHPRFDRWAYAWLGSAAHLAGWLALDTQQPAARLLELGRQAYLPLHGLSLDDLFSLWAGPDDGFAAGRALNPALLISCARAAVPLLRVDFDACGGAGISTTTGNALLGDAAWEFCRLPESVPGLRPWEISLTGDPYLALFCTVRRCVPLSALAALNNRGRLPAEAYTRAEREKHSAAFWLDHPDLPPAPPLSPDVPGRKVYCWKFQPRGAPVEIEQEISLEVSRTRYEEYRRKERFAGAWNRYAEEEMPEVRALAFEFQRLFNQQKWSTYNQAYDVLKFVQACFPYSSDQETTGHEDWPRYPIETLVDGTGDCEDLAVLCAAVIARLGFPTVLLLYPRHLAFGVAGAEGLKGDYLTDPRSGRRYFYGEATSNGWRLGEIPANYRGTAPEQILPVDLLLDENGE